MGKDRLDDFSRLHRRPDCLLAVQSVVVGKDFLLNELWRKTNETPGQIGSDYDFGPVFFSYVKTRSRDKFLANGCNVRTVEDLLSVFMSKQPNSRLVLS